MTQNLMQETLDRIERDAREKVACVMASAARIAECEELAERLGAAYGRPEVTPFVCPHSGKPGTTVATVCVDVYCEDFTRLAKAIESAGLRVANAHYEADPCYLRELFIRIESHDVPLRVYGFNNDLSEFAQIDTDRGAEIPAFLRKQAA